MASPQLENGYLKISTELFKEIYYRITNPTHIRIILFVIRFTYGYKRKEFDTNLSSIGTTLRLSTEYCRDMLYDLSDKCRILKIKWKTPQTLTIELVKDYDKWQTEGATRST